MAETGMQEPRFNSLLVKWTYRRVETRAHKKYLSRFSKRSQSGAANVMQPYIAGIEASDLGSLTKHRYYYLLGRGYVSRLE